MLQKAQLFTAVGKKVVMAITGLALCIFLVGHLAGNIQLFWNQPQFNSYAHFLTMSMGPLTILFELCLLAVFLLHIADGLILVKTNADARPIGYVKKGWAKSKSKKSRKTASSTFMMWSGIGILFFVIFHVWHFKYHHPIASVAPDMGGMSADPAHEQYDLALLVFNEFHSPLVAGIYIAAMALLGMHLYHAVSSALTTLGANHPRYAKGILWLGRIYTFVVCGIFALIPIAVFFHLVNSPVK